MKKTLLASIILILCFSGTAPAQSFDVLYRQTEQYKTLGSKLYNGTVSPAWTDRESFLFSTKEASGEKVYEVNVKKLTKTVSSRDSLDAILERNRKPYYEDPSDESYFSMRGTVREVSPDGRFVAFVRDNNIFIQNNSGDENAEARQLSFDGADHDRYIQILWSPDSRKIAALRKEEMKERQILLRESRPAGQVQPVYRWLDYAKPGDALPQETPALFDVEEMKQIPLETAKYSNQYFLELGEWSPDSQFFTFEYNKRGHQLYQLVAIDAVSGKDRILAEEKSDTFIYYYDIYRHYFGNGERILWISERDDWRHLYSIDPRTGVMAQLTKGEWNVREILDVNEKTGTVIFYANGIHADEGEDPYNKHVIRLDLKTGKWKDLTPENAFHQVSFNRDCSLFVDNMSRPDLPNHAVLRRTSDGKVVMDIQKSDISEIEKCGYTMPEVFSAKGRDGKTDIWGTIWRPSDFDAGKSYPVVEYIYAGPHDSHVDKTFIVAPRFIRLLQMGFIVVCIDGMGTDNRSKSFQDVAWRNLKDAGFPDRILWMKAAAEKYPYMDLSKVGIYGYSAGGQNTLSALLFYPEFYKVGVALCGCHDNRMDKIWWNEQWMGWPVGPWYSENSNVDNAWRLQGRLLLINGEMDDNVDPASTLQVVSELVKNNKDFEQLYLPGHTHNLGSEYITGRVFKFLWENCMSNPE